MPYFFKFGAILDELLTVSGEPARAGSFEVILETSDDSTLELRFLVRLEEFFVTCFLSLPVRFNGALSFFWRALLPMTDLILPFSSLDSAAFWEDLVGRWELVSSHLQPWLRGLPQFLQTKF